MNGRMSLCRDLIDKVVVDNYNVEIHYKFPVSGNSNTKRERPPFLLQELLPLPLLRTEADPPSGGVPQRGPPSHPPPPSVPLDHSKGPPLIPQARPQPVCRHRQTHLRYSILLFQPGCGQADPGSHGQQPSDVRLLRHHEIDSGPAGTPTRHTAQNGGNIRTRPAAHRANDGLNYPTSCS
jgi:hypothetical protein